MTPLSRRTLLAAGAATVVTANGLRWATAALDHGPAGEFATTRSRSGRAGDPDAPVGRAVDPAHRRRRRGAAGRRRGRHVGGRQRPDFSAPSRRAAPWPRSPRATACTCVDLAGPAWYRFRVGAWTSPGRARRPGGVGDSTAPRGDHLPALRDRLLRRAPRHRRVGNPTSWCGSATTSTRMPDDRSEPTACASHRGAEPTDLDAYRDRYARYLSDPELQAAARGVPVVRDLGRPRGREQLRRPHPQDPADAATFAARRSPPTRRGGSTAGAARPAQRRPSTRSSTARQWGDADRLHAARRPPIPHRPGVRRRDARPRPAVPRGGRSDSHDARRRAGAWLSRHSARRRRCGT